MQTTKQNVPFITRFSPINERDHKRAEQGYEVPDYCVNCHREFHAHVNGICPGEPKMPEQIISTGTTQRNSYYRLTVTLFERRALKNGKVVWFKLNELATATTDAKIMRLATEEAEKRGLRFVPHVRHLDAA